MKITKHSFIDAFRIDDGFSHEGLEALFDYFEDYEKSCDTELEFNRIAIRCKFHEFSSIEEFWEEYGKDMYPDFDTINERTQIIPVGKKGLIIQAF